MKSKMILVVIVAAMAAIAKADFAGFRDRAWVSSEGMVIRILEDDMEPPCHQRILLSDGAGRTLLMVNNIDGWPRLADVAVGDRVRFQGEFIDNEKGGLVHWTHPGPRGLRPGGWLKLVKRSDAQTPIAVPHEVWPPAVRKEYFAGRGPIATRTPAPINDDWPDTGYWLSTNSDARHNRNCENYRKTRGYPCSKDEGRPCGKCGG